MSIDLHDVHAEKALIGAALLDASVLDTVAVNPSAFADAGLRRVWATMIALHAEGVALDEVTVAAALPDRAQVPPTLMSECALATPTAANAAHYAAIVREHALTRAVLGALVEVREQHRLGKAAGSELLDAALQQITAIDVGKPTEALPIKAVLKERLRELDEMAAARQRGEIHLTGVPTGLDKLDDILGGFQPGIVTIVAGRPGMGKSAFALACTKAASERGYGVHVFSLEDVRAAYADRAISQASKVPAESIRNGRLIRADFERLSYATAELLRQGNWLYEDVSTISAEELVRSVRRERVRNGTKLVVLDYLQLLKRPRRWESVHDAIGQNIETLARAAKHDGIAYLVMSQLNRGVEQRKDKRPMLSDLRESGAIEERSKCVLGMYRGAYYGDPQRGVDYEDTRDCPDDHDWQQRIDILVMKNSNGQAGTYVRAKWDGPTTRIY